MLQSAFKVNFFPFSLIIAILYGLLVDAFGTMLHARQNGNARTKSMVAAVTLASIITGLLAAYTSITLGIVPYDPNLFYIVYVPIIIWGILSGALGGVLSARIWERNLKARFKSVQPTMG